MTKRRIIVVLGMHRSGTSALARGLKVLSVDLGDNLMPAIAGENDKGFWEDAEISKFNEKLLNKGANAWFRLAPVDANALCQDAYAQERYEATELLERKLRQNPQFGFKDPRTALLLPFWKCVFEDLNIEPNYLIALRNPLEVAESLRKRNAYEHTYSLTLWLKYMAAAVLNTEGTSRLCVSYRQLMASPLQELNRISAAFNLPAPSASDAAFVEYVSDFLSDELHRHRISDNEIFRSTSIPQSVAGLYGTLLDWADAPPGQQLTLPAKLKSQISTFWTVGLPLITLSDRLLSKANGANAKAANLEKEKAALSAKVDELVGQIAEKDQAIGDMISQQQELSRQAVDAAEREKAEREKEKAALTAKVEELVGQIAEKDQAIGDMISQQQELSRQAVDAAEREKAEREKEKAALTAKVEELVGQIAGKDKAIGDMISQQQELSRQAVDAAEREKAEREKEKAALSAKIEELSKQAADAVAKLQSDLAEQTLETQKLQQELSELEARYTAQLSLYQAQIVQAGADLDLERTRLAEADAQIHALNERLSAGQREKQELLATKREEEQLHRQQLREVKTEAIAQASRYQSQIAKAAADLASEKARVTDAETRIKALNNQIAAGKLETERLLLASRQAQSRLSELQTQLAEKTKDARLLRHEVHKLQASTSWRVTKPLRATGNALKHIRRLVSGNKPAPPPSGN